MPTPYADLLERIKFLGDQFQSHSMSRGIDDVEAAGLAMLEAATAIRSLQEESRLLHALLTEWFEMFSDCRRDGTEGADLIDRTALMLQIVAALAPKEPSHEH